VPEIIPDPDMISRLLFEPGMRDSDQDIFWDGVFQFPSDAGNCESVVWRKYAATIAEVHAMGCAKQISDRDNGRVRSTYFGAITGIVGDIRSMKSACGISFTVVHVPAEGIFHAHIGFSPGSKKNDRSELKVLLRSKFGQVESHTCL
jgi:hypothetical protein